MPKILCYWELSATVRDVSFAGSRCKNLGAVDTVLGTFRVREKIMSISVCDGGLRASRRSELYVLVKTVMLLLGIYSPQDCTVKVPRKMNAS